MASPQPEILPLEPGTVLDIQPQSPKSARCETESDEALIRMDGYSKVHVFERPCSRCQKTGRVCVTSGKKSVKCEWCRASKIKCDVVLVTSTEYLWLDHDGVLHHDSDFSHSTEASSTCAPGAISALAPEEIVVVRKWVTSTKDGEPIVPSSPKDFGAERPLTREAVSRIVQDDIKSDRFVEQVKLWQQKLQDSLLDAPTMKSTKRAIATLISSSEEDQPPKRKIKIKLRAPRVQDDQSSSPASPPKSRTSKLAPRRSRISSAIEDPTAHPTRSLRDSSRDSSSLPPLLLPESTRSGVSHTTPPPPPIRTIPRAAPPVTNLVSPRSLAHPIPLSRTSRNLQANSLLEQEGRNGQIRPRPLNRNELPAAPPVTNRLSPRTLAHPNPSSRTSQNSSVQANSLLEHERRNEQIRPLNGNELPAEGSGQGGNLDKDEEGPNKEDNNVRRSSEKVLSVDSVFLPAKDKQLNCKGTTQDDCSESDASSVEWRDVEPMPKPATFDGKIIAREVRKQAKLLEKFIENKTVEIACLIPQGQGFDSFRAIRQEIRTQLKVSRESLGTAVTPLEG